MKILLIHQYYLEKDDAGGSRWNEITKFWASKGHNITVLAGMINYASGKKNDKYKGKFIYDDQGFAKNIRVIRSYVSEAYNVNFLGRLWAYFSFVFSSLYTGIFKAKGNFDIIIVTSPPLFVGITAYVLSKFKHVPFIFEIRDLWPESAIDTGVLKNKIVIKMAYMFEAFLYKKAKLINVLTPAFRDKLIEKKNISDRKIIFIPNAADFSLSEELLINFKRDEFRKQNNFGENLVIIYVGAHGVANHLIQLIETAEILKNDPVLILSLGEGMQKKMLLEAVETKRLKNIRFLDAVPKREVFKYILAADLGTSVLKKVDTFKTVYSNKTFDYMSCKKPTLMVIDGVSRKLIEEAKAGIYVEPENPFDFAEKIRTYLNNPNLIQEHGENGYNYARTNFDRNVLANRYLYEIEKLHNY